MSRHRFATILVSAVLAACSGSSDATSPPQAVTGTLSIRVQGLDTTTAKAGVVTVERTDVSPYQVYKYDVPNGGSLDLSVPVGVYAISYQPPGGYSLASFSPVTAETHVDVAENASTLVTFGVRVADGFIFVEADIRNGPFPPTGGTASIVRTDVAGQDTTVTIDFSTEGYYTAVAVRPGSYSVTYHPPDGFDLVPGTGYTVSNGAGKSSTTIGPDYTEVLTYGVFARAP